MGSITVFHHRNNIITVVKIFKSLIEKSFCLSLKSVCKEQCTAWGRQHALSSETHLHLINWDIKLQDRRLREFLQWRIALQRRTWVLPKLFTVEISSSINNTALPQPMMSSFTGKENEAEGARLPHFNKTCKISESCPISPSCCVGPRSHQCITSLWLVEHGKPSSCSQVYSLVQDSSIHMFLSFAWPGQIFLNAVCHFILSDNDTSALLTNDEPWHQATQ